MSLTADISQALLRRETKEAVSSLLDKLTATDRKAVLLDLLTEAPTTAAVVLPAPVAAAPKAARPTAAPKPQEEPAKLSDRLLALVRQTPGMPISEMGQALYGDSGVDGQNKARSLMAALKKKGLVESFATGKWKAVEVDPFDLKNHGEVA